MEAKDVTSLLRGWYKSAKRYQLANRFAAKTHKRHDSILSTIVVITTVVVSTFIFISFGVTTSLSIQIAVAIISAINVITSILQVFLRLDEKSQEHQRADITFNLIARKINQEMLFISSEDPNLKNHLDIIRREMEYASNISPLVPERHWRKANNIVYPKESTKQQ